MITNLGHFCAGLSSQGVGIAFDSKFPLKGHAIECIYEGQVLIVRECACYYQQPEHQDR